MIPAGPTLRALAALAAFVLLAVSGIAATDSTDSRLLNSISALESGPDGEYLPLSLTEMIAAADRIVPGEVDTVVESMEEKTVDGVTAPFLVRKVSLIKIEILKGVFKPGSPIRHYASLALPVAKGDTVLWFLDRPTPIGFDPILGKFSGDFSVSSSQKLPGIKVAINKANNRGLWDNGKDGSLFKDGSELERSVRAKLEKMPGMDSSQITTILNYGKEPCQPRPIPLALIKAVVRAQTNTARSR